MKSLKAVIVYSLIGILVIALLYYIHMPKLTLKEFIEVALVIQEKPEVEMADVTALGSFYVPLRLTLAEKVTEEQAIELGEQFVELISEKLSAKGTSQRITIEILCKDTGLIVTGIRPKDEKLLSGR